MTFSRPSGASLPSAQPLCGFLARQVSLWSILLALLLAWNVLLSLLCRDIFCAPRQVSPLLWSPLDISPFLPSRLSVPLLPCGSLCVLECYMTYCRSIVFQKIHWMTCPTSQGVNRGRCGIFGTSMGSGSPHIWVWISVPGWISAPDWNLKLTLRVIFEFCKPLFSPPTRTILLPWRTGISSPWRKVWDVRSIFPRCQGEEGKTVGLGKISRGKWLLSCFLRKSRPLCSRKEKSMCKGLGLRWVYVFGLLEELDWL